MLVRDLSELARNCTDILSSRQQPRSVIGRSEKKEEKLEFDRLHVGVSSSFYVGRPGEPIRVGIPGICSQKKAVQAPYADGFKTRTSTVARHSRDRTFGGGDRLVETA